MRSIVILLCILSTKIYCQTPEQVLDRFFKSVDDIQQLSYHIHRIDSFLSGTVWNMTGSMVMERDHLSDKLSDFSYYGVNNLRNHATAFDGKWVYEINFSDKTYEIDSVYTHPRQLIGNIGGQMILSQLFMRELTFPYLKYDSLYYTRTDSSYILKLYFPDIPNMDIKNQILTLHLDQQNMLPFYMYHYLEASGEKQIRNAWLSDIEVKWLSDPRVNGSLKSDLFKNYEYLEGYRQVDNKNLVKVEDHTDRLIGKKIEEFQLKGLDSLMYTIPTKSKKLLLLDFWEIWCGPCIESLPKLKRIAETYKDDLELISILSDPKTFDRAGIIINRKGIEYPVLLGNSELKSRFHAIGVPLYVLVNEEGIITYASLGYKPEMENEIISQLKQ
ncbi:MAG: TlpA family protein disulfide reductase [Bacteroidota bacterium]